MYLLTYEHLNPCLRRVVFCTAFSGERLWETRAVVDVDNEACRMALLLVLARYLNWPVGSIELMFDTREATMEYVLVQVLQKRSDSQDDDNCCICCGDHVDWDSRVDWFGYDTDHGIGCSHCKPNRVCGKCLFEYPSEPHGDNAPACYCMLCLLDSNVCAGMAVEEVLSVAQLSRYRVIEKM